MPRHERGDAVTSAYPIPGSHGLESPALPSEWLRVPGSDEKDLVTPETR